MIQFWEIWTHANECWHRKEGKENQKSNEEAHIAHYDDYYLYVFFLMAVTCQGNYICELWYLGLGCSNHMTTHKYWFTNFDQSIRTNVRITNNNYLKEKIICDIVNRINDGKNSLIEKVLYVHGMMWNLMSIG